MSKKNSNHLPGRTVVLVLGVVCLLVFLFWKLETGSKPNFEDQGRRPAIYDEV